MPGNNPSSTAAAPNLLGPDIAGEDWRQAKMLEVLGQIQREQLAASKTQGEINTEMALIKRDLFHLVETFGARVDSAERRLDAADLRATSIEQRGDARLTALETKLVDKVERVEAGLASIALVDAGRRGMVAGAVWLWGALIVMGGYVVALTTWVFTHKL